MVNIDINKCTGCGACVADCFVGAINVVDNKAEFVGKVCMQCGHCTAVCPTGAITMPGYNPKEILEYDAKTFKVEPENMMNFLKFRRSVRQFEQRAVSNEDLEKILEAGRYCPTGSNYQNIRYIVTSLETTQKLKAMAREFLGGITNEELEAGIPEFKELWPYHMGPSWATYWSPWVKDYETTGWDKFYRGAPQFLLPVCEKNRFSDGFLAIRSIELAAEVNGVGTCYLLVGTPGIAANPKARELLGLAPNEAIPVVMGIGYHHIKYYRTVNRKPLVWEVR